MSSVGNKTARRGVTLIEMTVVLAIVGLIVGVTLPSATSGLSSIRLKGASGDVASFLNSALNRAERHEQVMEIIVYPKERKLELDSSEPGYARTLEMPQGVNIAGEDPVRILLMPGSAPPRVEIDLYNDNGAHRIVKLDPVTGVPLVVVPQEAAQ
jgi:prepilin-type N-terminal cleavage/methylation domain-containing protein